MQFAHLHILALRCFQHAHHPTTCLRYPQAWGLMELQRGNWLAAVRLLERSARLDVSCRPVLRWQVVQTARKTVGSRRGGQGSGSNSQQSPCSELAE